MMKMVCGVCIQKLAGL